MYGFFFLNVNSFFWTTRVSSSFCQIQSEEDPRSPAGQAAGPAVAAAATPLMLPSSRIHGRSARTPRTPRGDPAAEPNPLKFQPSPKKPPARRPRQLRGSNASRSVMVEEACNRCALGFSAQTGGVTRSQTDRRTLSEDVCGGGPRCWGVRLTSPL